MSVLGTGVAAGIAQTALQAQQAARQHDKQDTQTGSESRAVRDLFETFLDGFEDSSRDDSATHVHVDGEVSQQPNAPQDQPRKRKNPSDPADPAVLESTDVPTAIAAPPPAEPDAPLYRHLDVQA